MEQLFALYNMEHGYDSAAILFLYAKDVEHAIECYNLIAKIPFHADTMQFSVAALR